VPAGIAVPPAGPVGGGAIGSAGVVPSGQASAGGFGYEGCLSKGFGKGFSKGGPPTVPREFEIDTDARFTGTVRDYWKWKGYGHINMNQKGIVPNDLLFVHWRNIQSSDRFPSLMKDIEVEFGILKYRDIKTWSNDLSSLRAKTVTLPGGETIAIQNEVDAQKKSFVGGQDLRYTGRLKWYDPMWGYGYVSLDPGFVVEADVPSELRVESAEVNAGGRLGGKMQDLTVEFGIWKSRRGVYKVYNMTLPNGIPMTQEALEHRATAASQTFQGVVTIWNWQQGWGFIDPDDTTPLPDDIVAKLAEQNQNARAKATARGRTFSDKELLYFRKSDVARGLRLEKDMTVLFQVYTDDKGAGACEIQGTQGL